MSELSPDNLYEWPDDYFRSERVFRVARATNNLYRQMRNSDLAIEDALRFESAVISMAVENLENIPVNWTNYKPLERVKDKTEQKRLLETIQKGDLSLFLKKEVVKKNCDPGNIAFLESFCADAFQLNTPKDVEDAYLELVALYSRVPVNGYAARMLNEQYFGDHADAAFFLVHVAPQDQKNLGLLSLWSCTPQNLDSWNTQRVVHKGKQTPDPNIVGERDDFFINHLMRVVRLQEFDESGRNPQKPGKQYHLIAIPLRTLHKSSRDQSAGTFLGWLFVHCPEWNVKVRKPDIKETVEPIVEKLWPLLDDYASSLLDGEIEERLAMFGRVGSQEPLQFIKDQISSLSGWECVDDPVPADVRGIHYYKPEGDTLLLVLTPAQSGREAVAIRLHRKQSTRIPTDEALLNHGSKRFCQRIRSFYEQAKLRSQERLNAQNQGFLISAHDYSKDVGTACLKMMEFNETLKRSREAISQRARRMLESPQSAAGLATEIESELSHLDAPRMEWFANVRFTYAHLQTRTTGALAGEPPECIAMLEEGTLQSINKLVDHLVWLPLDYGGYKEIEDSLRKTGKLDSGHHLQHPQTWASLFRYDMVPAEATSPFHAKLGQHIGELILKEKITELAFFDRFLPPEIKIVVDTQSSLDPDSLDSLWQPSGEDGVSRWTPIDGLLPLFVFSLRFAFQCAWGKTLLHAPREAECIHISPSRPSPRSYRLAIAFSSPSPETRHLNELPYSLEWQRQMSYYTGRTFPWSAGGTESVTLFPEDGRIQVTLTASV